MGGYLAELTTAEEDISLGNYLIQGVFYWIGLTDNVEEGTWRWTESHQKTNYTNWWTGQPNGDDRSNCVFKSVSPAYLGWADYACSLDEWSTDQIHALCEIEPSKV